MYKSIGNSACGVDPETYATVQSMKVMMARLHSVEEVFQIMIGR